MSRIPPPLDPKYFVPFSLYAILLAFIAALIVETIKHPPGDHSWSPGYWLISSVLLFAVAAVLYERHLEAALRNWRRRNESIRPEFSPKRVRGAKGLALLVSRDEGVASALEALRHHRSTLTHLWLIVSSDSGSLANAGRIGKEAHALNPGIAVTQTEPVPMDIEQVVRVVTRVRDEALRAGIQPDDLVCDFTGMTKIHAVGMVLASLQTGARLSYMTPGAFREGGRPDPSASSHPVEIRLAYTLERGED